MFSGTTAVVRAKTESISWENTLYIEKREINLYE